MKTIAVTYISPLESARQCCAELERQNRDIEVVAIPGCLSQPGAWQVLSLADVVVIDEAAIRLEGFETVRMLLAGDPGINCLIVMNEAHEPTMVWALAHGVRGILLKGEVEALITRAIRQVHAGEVWVSRRVAGRLREAVQQGPGSDATPAHDAVPVRGWTKWH
jgi:DNA-binding NarL/FixJ family response regulator